MQYDLTATLKNEKGEVIVEEGVTVTMRAAFTRALLSEWVDGGAQLRIDEKARRYQLFLLINTDATIVDLTTEQAATLKGAIGAFPTLIYGQLAAYLDRGYVPTVN